MSDTTLLAFDLGGTDLKVGRVDASGTVHDFQKLPSRANEGEAPLFEAVTTAANTVGSHAARGAAGFGSPGVLHPVSGIIVDRTPNLNLSADFPMRARLESVLGRKVAIDNDANMAALAEHTAGAGKGARVSLTITVGTGVGCGIVVDGRVLKGAMGGAGEIGHMPLGSTGPACGCGVVGCAEPMASGSGLIARAREAGLDVSNAREVFESSDPRAAEAIARMVDHLARMVSAATALLNPDVIVIGGGVAQAGPKLFGPLEASCKRYMLASHRQHLRIVPATLGERAGVIGAGLAAWQLQGNG
ncbi:MAG: ROK family protein [Candidatus Eisenbacteria bacterium]|nr:ROK family protein [Candidatus Eisenbacteria bacterium]